MSKTSATPLPPLQRSISVPWAPEAAFRRFTEEIASWWPLRSHSVGQERADTVVFEGRVGGRIVERLRSGEESIWGTVLACEPPARLVFTWHPGRGADTAQEIEVRFMAQGAGTRVELIHYHWERLADLAGKARRGYALGWSYMLRVYAGRGGSPLVWGLNGLMWALRPLQRRASRRAARAATGD